jgi:HK97 family phage prohead protease
MSYDFGGYATKNDLRCSDGRIIRSGAFKDCDGATVPLVWQHMHDSPDNILGHAELENRDDGVYAYCTFNSSPAGTQAMELVKHGDIGSLSIYANRLRQNGSDVVHGIIREVSLVLAGANPGAIIDNVCLEHSDGFREPIEDEAIISTNEPLEHADSDEDRDPTVAEVFDTLTEEQKTAVYAIIGAIVSDQEEAEAEEVQHSDEESAEFVYKPEEQVVADEEEVIHSDENEEDLIMKHNAFDQTEEGMENILTHADMDMIFADAKRCGSLKAACNDHFEHGITPIGDFFPSYKNVQDQPYLISRPMEWVSKVLGAVHHTPFSKVRSLAANITADAARAKGYVTGTQKVEEQITALHRETDPTTIYKLQKLNRDDVIDITDFDVVAWIKQEMRVMLDEEVARAILVGDGRLSDAPDKIKEDKIRPIWTDDEVYTVHSTVDASLTGSAKAQAFIDQVIRQRKNYKGSGAPTLYVGSDLLTEMRLIKNAVTGDRIYKSDKDLADEMRVANIVEIELLDGLTRTVSEATHTFGGIIVNLADYNVGATRGGEVNLFDDFDIDYNKLEYLIETRMSGALVRPKSALAIEFAPVAAQSNNPE